MTPRNRFISVLDRKPPQGRVPHFELVFFLTMEAFGKVHPCHRNYSQWDQMQESQRKLHRIDMAEILIATAERFEHSAIVIPSAAFFWWNATELFHLIDLIREKSGDRYCLLINMDGTYDVPGGGYIFSTSNCVYTGMKLSRYELMLDVWRQEGNYLTCQKK